MYRAESAELYKGYLHSKEQMRRRGRQYNNVMNFKTIYEGKSEIQHIHANKTYICRHM